ncbi:MAG: TonB-dependent receptor [Deltaproteobacteria bacterium]|nr:TonB-dependent receptor [Deltaproteobacteria bacterium]
MAILFFLGATSAEAAPVRTSSVTYQVEVRDRVTPGPQDPTATRTELSSARIARARRRGEEVGALVDAVAGARVLDLGGPLAQKRLTLRGGSPAQAAVMIDGVVLRSPFAGGIDLGLFPAELLEGVTVYRGGQGATFGEGALTGALSLRTRGPSLGLRRSVTASLGAFDSRSVMGTASLAPVSVGASWSATAGNFPYLSQLPGLPERARVRPNNQSQRAAAFVSMSEQSGGVDWSFLAAGTQRAAGVPGLADTPGESFTAQEDQRSLLARTTAAARLGAIRTQLGLDVHYLELDYQDSAQDLLSNTRFMSVGAEVGGRATLGEHQRWSLELRGAAEQAISSVYDVPTRPRGVVSLADHLVWGPVLGFVGLRIEAAGQQPALVLPRLGVDYAWAEGWSLRAGVSRSARLPSLDELYHPPEAGYVGNPELLPESAWEVEVGLGVEEGGLRLGLTAFGRRLEETILYLNRNAFAVRPENLGAARALGLEAELRYQTELGPVALGTELSGAWLEAELEATSAPLPTQPRFAGAGAVDLAWGPFELGLSARAFSSTFVTLRPTDENVVPAYLRADASLILAPVEHFSVAASVLNLFDDRSLTSVQRIPLPGRTWLITLRIATEGEAT